MEASSAADSVLCPMCPGHPADRFNCYNTLQHHMKSSHGLTLTLGSVIKKASFFLLFQTNRKNAKKTLFLSLAQIADQLNARCHTCSAAVLPSQKLLHERHCRPNSSPRHSPAGFPHHKEPPAVRKTSSKTPGEKLLSSNTVTITGPARAAATVLSCPSCLWKAANLRSLRDHLEKKHPDMSPDSIRDALVDARGRYGIRQILVLRIRLDMMSPTCIFHSQVGLFPVYFSLVF